jgi:hypothetical protein
MSKYLLEVQHEADVSSCLKAVKVLLETGSHFLTRADFGCHDGVHSAWIVVETDRREDALNIVPRAYREQTRVVELTNFSLEEVDNLMQHHES